MALTPAVALAQAPDIKRAKTGGWDISVAGPATLSVDGRKVADLTTATYHLEALKAGVHKLDVGSARILLREPRGKLAASAPTDPRAIDIAIAGTAVSATGATLNSNTLRVTQGDLVRLRFTADSAMTIHFHGYDIEAAIGPEMPATMVFDAEIAGRFPIEKHGGREVRLLFVEVYPK